MHPLTLIRAVCDKLLAKDVPEKQRYLRAEAILMIGKIFRAAERDPGQADSGDYMFEQLLAASSQKKKKTRPTKSQQEQMKARQEEFKAQMQSSG